MGLIHSISDFEARQLVMESLIAPDFRNEHHVRVGYIPCRIFKNISYGVLPGTNSKLVNHFFEKLLPYSENPAELFYPNIEEINKHGFGDKMKHLKNITRLNHTFVNRAEQLLALM
jgi:hypothetical protein